MNYPRVNKQLELFPLIIDQELIDNYVEAQKSLKEWKEAQRGYISAANANIQLLQYSQALKEDENFTELYIRQCIAKANKALQTCAAKLTEIKETIATVEELIGFYNDFIISFPTYTKKVS